MSSLKNEMRKRKANAFLSSIVHNKMALTGTIILGFIILVAIFGPIFVPFSSTDLGNVEDMLLPPSARHWLGTDDMGRDVLANLMSGARISLLIGTMATLISMIIGTLVGIASGYFGKAVDNVLMRLTDFFLVIPCDGAPIASDVRRGPFPKRIAGGIRLQTSVGLGQQTVEV